MLDLKDSLMLKLLLKVEEKSFRGCVMWVTTVKENNYLERDCEGDDSLKEDQDNLSLSLMLFTWPWTYIDVFIQRVEW
jgi:hypothetical protein